MKSTDTSVNHNAGAGNRDNLDDEDFTPGTNGTGQPDPTSAANGNDGAYGFLAPDCDLFENYENICDQLRGGFDFRIVRYDDLDYKNIAMEDANLKFALITCRTGESAKAEAKLLAEKTGCIVAPIKKARLEKEIDNWSGLSNEKQSEVAGSFLESLFKDEQNLSDDTDEPDEDFDYYSTNGSNPHPAQPVDLQNLKTKYDWAMAYAQCGYYVFLLAPNTKGTLIRVEDGGHGHLQATIDPILISYWFSLKYPDADIGINLERSGLVCLDPDRHHEFKDGIKDFEALPDYEEDWIKNCPTATTAQNGKHWFFRLKSARELHAGGEHIPKYFNGDKNINIDLKYNGYAVVQPSTYKGKGYIWDPGKSLLEIEPPELPEKLRKYVVFPGAGSTRNRSSGDGNGGGSMGSGSDEWEWDDSDWNQEAYIKHLDKFDGDNRYQRALEGHDFGLSPEVVMELITEHYNHKCANAYDSEKVETIVRNAYQYAHSDPGSRYRPPGWVEFADEEPSAGYGDDFEDDYSLPPEPGVGAEADEGAEAPKTQSNPEGERGKTDGPNGGAEKRPPDDALAPSGEMMLTDIGNAKEFARKCGDTVIWIKKFKSFYIWTGNRWAPDDQELITKYAKEVLISIFERGVKTERKSLSNWALDCARNAGRHISAMTNLAKNMLAHSPADLNQDGWLFNCENGTIDLRSGQLKEHDPKLLITKLSPVAYDPEAIAPHFQQFLIEIFEGKVNLITYMQKFIGYSLTADVREQILDFWYGLGSNGKGVLLRILMRLLGDYAQMAPTQILFTQSHRGIPNDVARLFGARLVFVNEGEENKQFDEQMVKALTGGENLVGRFLNQEWFDFPPSHKMVLVSNHKPTVKNADKTDNHSLWRRIRAIPFSVIFATKDSLELQPDQKWLPKDEKEDALKLNPKDEKEDALKLNPKQKWLPKDENLFDELVKELPGILAWAVQGCLMWQRDGLEPSDEILLATESYRSETDTVSQFLDIECQHVDDKELKKGADKKATFWAYQEFCKDTTSPPLELKKFYKQMEALGLEGRNATGRWFWLQIGDRPGTKSTTTKQNGEEEFKDEKPSSEYGAETNAGDGGGGQPEDDDEV